MKKTNELNKQKTVENLVGATIGRPLLQRLGPNKGITLVALVITIVLMLILATVTVNVVIDGGLFEYAGNAKDSVEVASEKETIQKAFIFAESASKTGRITKAELQKSINKVMNEDNATVYDFDEDFVIIFGTKRAYTIDKKGKILGMEENYKSPNKIFLAQVSDNTYGTATKPYEINCIEDLVDLSYAVNGIEVLEDGTLSYTATVNSFTGKNIALIKNLSFTSELSYENAERTDYGDINGNEKVEDLLTELTTGTGWLPIGNAVKSGSCFFGIFNGKGKKISSLYINNAEETNYSGLFGNTRDGEIINLAVSGDIYCNSLYAGGIVGYPYAWNKTYIIDNCSFNGKIENINTGDHGFVGGLVGTPAGALDVTNSYNEATVIGKKNSGGISGSGGRNFINCHNKGDVKGENYVGGITSNRRSFF